MEEKAERCQAAGNNLYLNHKYGAAVKQYKKATKFDPTQVHYWSQMAACYEKLQDWETMQATAHHCVELDPTFVNGYYWLAFAQAQLQAVEEARSTLQRGLAIDPNNYDLGRFQAELQLAQHGMEETGADDAAAVATAAAVRTVENEIIGDCRPLYLPPTEGFRCWESLEQDGAVSSVIFHCTLPPALPSSSAVSISASASVSSKNIAPPSLEFVCREPSCGALILDNDNVEDDDSQENETDPNHRRNNTSETSAVDLLRKQEEDEQEENYGTHVVDPNFFDAGYTMAGTTGFKVWTGSRLLIETLVAGPWFGSPSSLPEMVVPQQPPQNNSNNCHRNLRRLHEIQQRLQQDKHPVRILELGAGVGLVGTYLAAATGAEVLLTDLPTLVEHAIVPNLYRNHELFLVDPTSTRTITTLDTNNDTNKKNNHDHDGDNIIDVASIDSCYPLWLAGAPNEEEQDKRPIQIGNGYANAVALDWTRPIEEQLTAVQQATPWEFIIASDVVFLVDMMTALFDTVAALFQMAAAAAAAPPSFIVSFQRRDSQEGDASTIFTTVNRVFVAVQERGWQIQCLSWRPVTVHTERPDTGCIVPEQSDVYVFEITP